MQMDDPHETAAHSHPPNVDAVEVAKSSSRMRTAIQASAAAKPSQVA